MKEITVIGLTGLSGSGKSTVADIFKSRGAAVIDCDVLARSVTEKGKPCLNELADEFGGEILQNDGSLNRKALAKIAFSTDESTKRLNKITHAYIMKEIEKSISDYKAAGKKTILLDAPQLFESGADKMCDFTVCVIAQRNTAEQRIILRDKIDANSAAMRLDRQFTNDFFKSHSDFIINNDTTLNELENTVNSVYDEIIKTKSNDEH